MTHSDLPGELSGTHPLRAWLNKLRRAVIARTPQKGPGYRIGENTTGFGLEIIDRGGSGLSISLYRLKTVQGDYLTCKAWDGTSAGEATSDASPDVYIAKPQKMWHSIDTETIEGVPYYYTYAADEPNALNRYRNVYSDAAHTTFIERLVITPEWLLNDMIWAVPAPTGVYRTPPATDPVTLLMLHPRYWALHE